MHYLLGHRCFCGCQLPFGASQRTVVGRTSRVDLKGGGTDSLEAVVGKKSQTDRAEVVAGKTREDAKTNKMIGVADGITAAAQSGLIGKQEAAAVGKTTKATAATAAVKVGKKADEVLI
jgi:hypothetical protein